MDSSQEYMDDQNLPVVHVPCSNELASTAHDNTGGADEWPSAEYPRYAGISDRIKSFQSFPWQNQNTRDKMAIAGLFYTGEADYTMCFYCGVGLGRWMPGDIPTAKHHRWSPKCRYARELAGFDQPVENSNAMPQRTLELSGATKSLEFMEVARNASQLLCEKTQSLLWMSKAGIIGAKKWLNDAGVCCFQGTIPMNLRCLQVEGDTPTISSTSHTGMSVADIFDGTIGMQFRSTHFQEDQMSIAELLTESGFSCEDIEGMVDSILRRPCGMALGELRISEPMKKRVITKVLIDVGTRVKLQGSCWHVQRSRWRDKSAAAGFISHVTRAKPTVEWCGVKGRDAV